MGVWIAIAIGLFVIGNIMALKPNAIDIRLDKLRMSARKLGLHPKLIACPSWVRGKDNEFGKGMIAQYAVVLENARLPQTYYQVIEGHLRPVAADNLPDTLQQSIYQSPHAYENNIYADNAHSALSKRVSGTEGAESKTIRTESKSTSAGQYVLDNEALQLPEAIALHVKAVYSKANSVVVFWEDIGYVRPNSNPHYNTDCIEPDLSVLKQRLTMWATKLAASA